MGRILQFKISLDHIQPEIWRRIQISDRCTFWSLHVALQDAMGWLDYHLHEFLLKDPVTNNQIRMGITFEDDIEGMNPNAGWEHRVWDYLAINPKFKYIYDFGDYWEHTIKFEGVFDKTPGVKYPLCVDGARNCPPEDVGSIPGYYEFIEAIKNKHHPEHKSLLSWIGGHYDPEDFSLSEVRFSRPSDRLKRMLEGIG